MWKRGIYNGCCGVECIPFGGYHLVKVMDGDGRKVQPYYDDFISYMGDVGIFVWAGNKPSGSPSLT